ncbi:hypothetical protein G7Y31_11475 [Corynebacterium lizhenjunii]|uniref:Uncharacterized protein n=1 Tax=Corynebacterium lizhenjunii TaxID=2709394 RepID=A0A7T0KEZ8_9CORY|nr:hypothetical protein [Corynebacterium lizhenjunii]QPK79090.1 hypothetical protein G7Y31_11475 [Corynebacterium lizhenjunii]
MTNAHMVSFLPESHSLYVARYVAIPVDATMGELLLIGHAALGLEPSAPGTLQVAGDDVQVIDVMDEPAIDYIDAYGEAVVYRPSVGEWNIGIYPLGETQLSNELPQLIDATGPDLLPAAGSLEGMAIMLGNVRQLLSGFIIDAESTQDLMGAFPNYSVDQMRKRLSDCYQPAITQRLFEMAAKPLNLDEIAMLDDGPRGRDSGFADEDFDERDTIDEWYVWDDREGSIFHDSPRLNPRTELAELTQADIDAVAGRLRAYFAVLAEHPQMTPAGYLNTRAVKKCIEVLGLEAYRGCIRENQVWPLQALRNFLVNTGWLEQLATKLRVYGHIEKALNENPNESIHHLLGSIPYAYTVSESALRVGLYMAELYRGKRNSIWEDEPANTYTRDLLQALGVMQDQQLVDARKGVVAEIIRNLRIDFQEG